MSWRQIVEPVFAGWPGTLRSQAMQSIADENDHAERLGYTCHLDDRRGFGRCYFIKDNVRVWHSADGWVSAACKGVVGVYRERRLYHTLDQALRDANHFASVNAYGHRIK